MITSVSLVPSKHVAFK